MVRSTPRKYKKRKRKWKATGGVPHILAAHQGTREREVVIGRPSGGTLTACRTFHKNECLALNTLDSPVFSLCQRVGPGTFILSLTLCATNTLERHALTFGLAHRL